MENLLDINTMAHKAMLITLSISQWTARKKDKKVSAEVAQAKGVKADVGSYYKPLVDPASLETVKKIVSRARDRHYQMTLPWSDTGPRILSSELYLDYMQEMGQYKREFDTAVATIMAEYPQLRLDAQQMLGPMFDSTEYPSPEALLLKFGFSLDVMPLPAATDFRCELDDVVVNQIQKEIEGRLQATAKTAIGDAFARCQKLLERYMDRLGQPDSVFHDTMVEQAHELADMIPKLNFINDPDLNELAARIKDGLCQHTPDQLRHVPTARQETFKKAKEISDDFSNFFS